MSAHALPGEAYAERDQAIFSELEDLLFDARLSPRDATQLGSQLAERFTSPGRGLERIATMLPALALLQLIVGGSRDEMRRAEGMLATLFAAIAAGRAQSASVPPAAPPRPAKAGEGLL